MATFSLHARYVCFMFLYFSVSNIIAYSPDSENCSFIPHKLFQVRCFLPIHVQFLRLVNPSNLSAYKYECILSGLPCRFSWLRRGGFRSRFRGGARVCTHMGATPGNYGISLFLHY